MPCPDPWDVARKIAHLPHLLFLDSAEKHTDRGRYSYVMADPLRSATASDFDCDSFEDHKQIEGLPPFQGGWGGVFGYDFGRRFERIPQSRHDEFRFPDVKLFAYDWVVAFDHQREKAWIISTGRSERDGAAVTTQAQRRLQDVKACLASAQRREALSHSAGNALAEAALVPQFSVSGLADITSNFTRDGYENAVQRAIEYIHAGDCFQVNLSQRLLTRQQQDPFELYAQLRERSPSPFGGYFDAGEFQVLSASPERFLKSTHGIVETRPIKGTRPRGTTPESDAELMRDLLASPKDRAENVMIVDLLRNDLGRVCEFGSVQVTALCEVETFRHVHHLVSEVRGRLQRGMGPFDLIRSSFPGGSVTGAPKVRAMEIIAELEPTARGPYCGAMGFIGFDGTCDTNILIRTMTVSRGWVQFPVGGGIVADSDPRREYEETLHKAAGLIRALDPS